MSNKYTNSQTKQPTVALSFELYTTTITAVVEFWKATKLFNTAPHKADLLIVNSTATFKTIINTRYPSVLVEGNPAKLEDLYGTQFAKDVVTDAMQELLTGNPVH